MNYKLTFETNNVLSVGQLALIFNAIQPTDVIATQQGNNKLICNLSFDREITKEEVNNLLSDAKIDFATCINCIRVDKFEVFIKL